jgi:Domain of unknown function (DUF4123)
MSLFADFVADAVAGDSPVAAHRYLLVDTSATHGIHVSKELRLYSDAIDVLTRAPCDWNESASPVLVWLPQRPATPAKAERLKNWLLRWRYGNCVSYIESELAMQDLAAELHSRCDALLPDNMPVVLRYFDGRVMSALLRTLKPEQLASFLQCASRWAFADRSGELVLLPLQPERPAAHFNPPLVLDVEQQAALIDAGEADAVVGILLDQMHYKLMPMRPPEQHDTILKALHRAQELKLTRLSDQISFCSLWLELGNAFDETESWAPLMRQVAAGEMSFEQALAAMASRQAS